MKLFKIILGFIIFYFIITAFSSMINLAKKISLGNELIEYAFYVLMLILFIIYILIPLLKYLKKPSLTDIKLMTDGNKKSLNKICKHLKKTLTGNDLEEFIQLEKSNKEALTNWIKAYIKRQTHGFNNTINQYGLKLTATVLISPNPFIDGITILYGNSKMIYELSKKINFRYSWKQLWNMYFAVLSIASITGIIQEFDEEIEDIFEEIAEEFRDFIKEESGKSVGDSIPIANILFKAVGPIMQAASNYAFIIYNGKRFQYTILNTVNTERKTEDEIKKISRKESRKESRKSKYKYMEDMIKKMGLNSFSKVKTQFEKVKDNVSKSKYLFKNTKKNET
jgi:hypothetical protein